MPKHHRSSRFQQPTVEVTLDRARFALGEPLIDENLGRVVGDELNRLLGQTPGEERTGYIGELAGNIGYTDMDVARLAARQVFEGRNVTIITGDDDFASKVPLQLDDILRTEREWMDANHIAVVEGGQLGILYLGNRATSMSPFRQADHVRQTVEALVQRGIAVPGQLVQVRDGDYDDIRYRPLDK